MLGRKGFPCTISGSTGGYFSMFSWLRHLAGFESPAAKQERQKIEREEAREVISESLELGLRMGFYDDAAVLQRAVDSVEDDISESDARMIAHEMFPGILQAYFAAVRTWPAETDCDRMVRAFERLEESGIIALHHYSCCGTCGAAAVAKEMEEAHEEGRPVRGYTFYHQQDTESAASGSCIYLSYGAWKGGGRETEAIAREIISVLNDAGLSTDWNGSLNQRIELRVDWKRRRDT